MVADERDVIRLRTNYRKEQVHLYQLRTPVSRAREDLLDYVASINALDDRASLQCRHRELHDDDHAPPPQGRALVSFDWRVIANGRLDELLYERGVIDTSRPFPEVRQATLINARAEAADQDPQFSARIREVSTRPPLLVLPAGTN